jgi:hypothetical protein
MPTKVDGELIEKAIMMVRHSGHTGTTDVELRMLVTLCHSRNIGKTAEDIAEIVGKSLGRTGGSTRQDRDGALKKSDNIEDPSINNSKIYDQYTDDSWKEDS